MRRPPAGPAKVAARSPAAIASDRSHRYFAFGMAIHSDLELPELPSFDAPSPDLTFSRATLSRQAPEGRDAVFEFFESGAYLGFGGIAQFLVPRPELVLFDPDPDADFGLLTLGLLGSVIATVLHLRGCLTMHASGIEIDGRGVVFMGDKGAGKSTTAAAFVAAGHRLLTDDVLPIEIASDGRFSILPGFAQLKLSDAACRQVDLPDATASPISDIGFNKSRLRLGGRFSAEPVAPSVFYVLTPGDRFATSPLLGVEAMTALMANAYHARYGSQVFHGVAAAAHMRRCAALARAVPVRLLRVPQELDRLPELVGFVERDVGPT